MMSCLLVELANDLSLNLGRLDSNRHAQFGILKIVEFTIKSMCSAGALDELQPWCMMEIISVTKIC